MGLDKGIRVGSLNKFNEMLPQWRAMGGKAFRRYLLDWTVENYGVTMAASSSHYSHALNLARKNSPELVEGLGRPTPTDALTDATLVPGGFVDAESIVPTEFVIRVKRTGEIIADGVGFEAARALVNKAAAQKKAKLYFV